MKNKGFTLIELLAVIVILAIIALIATPIILNIIDSSKTESLNRSRDNYLHAVEIAIANYQLNHPEGIDLSNATCIVTEDGNLECGDDEIQIPVTIDGTKPTEGRIIFNNNKIVVANAIIDGTLVEGTGQVESEKVYIYRNSEKILSIGDNINKLESYETDLSKIDTNFYLKHAVVNDIITESYACMTYVEDETTKEACLRGGLGYTDIIDLNETTISNLNDYFSNLDFLTASGRENKNEFKGYCTSSTTGTSSCKSDFLNMDASKRGFVSAYDDSFSCDVGQNGSSSCYEY